MHTQTSQKAELFARALRMGILGVFAVFACTLLLSLLLPDKTTAATSNTVNFQARLQSASGAIAPDGNYDITFHLFNSSTAVGGTSTDTGCGTDTSCEWVEQYTYNSGPGSSDVRVRVANGYLTVNLGSITAFSGINWDQQQWLTMDIGGTTGSGVITWDTQMAPRLLLTATPYAFVAGQLQVTNGANVAKLVMTAAPSSNFTITVPNETGTVCTNAATGACTSAGGFVQLQSATPGTAQTGNFNINSGTGILGVLQAATAAAGSLLTVQGGAANSGTNAGGNLLLQGGAGNSTGASGSVFVKSNGNNSASAFQVQNASSGNLFTVDTSNTAIVLGNDGTTAALTVRGGAATGTNATGSNLTFDASNGTGTGGSGDFIFRTGSGTAAVIHDAASTSSSASAGSLTWNHTVGAGSNGLLIVGVGNTLGQTVSSVTYNSVALTKLTSVDCTSVCHEEFWYLKSPAAGTNSIVVTFSASTSSAAAGASSYFNVNQTTPFGTAAVNTSIGTNASVTVTTSSGQLVVDAAVTRSGSTLTAAAAQTQHWNVTDTGNRVSAGSSLPASGSSTSMSWTVGTSTDWGEIGVGINPASTSSTSDTLTDRFHVASSGNVGINAVNPQYTLDVSGTGNFSTAVRTPFLQSAAAAALTITGNAASTWSTSAGNLTIQAGSGTVSLGTSTALTAGGALTVSGGTTLILQSTGANAVTLDSGTTGTVNVGIGANSKSIQIGVANSAITDTIGIGNNTNSSGISLVTIGSTSSSSATTIQGGTGNISLITNSASASALVKTLTNSATAFQVQNTAGTAALIVDTTQSQLQLRNLNDGSATGSELFSFGGSTESLPNVTGWVGSGTGSSATSTHSAGTTALIASPVLTPTIGTMYKVTYTLSGYGGSGTVTAKLGGTSGSSISANGTQTDYLVATTTGNLTFTPTTAFVGTIASISVLPVSTQTAALAVNDSAGSGAFELRVSTAANGNLGLGINALAYAVSGSGQFNVAAGSGALQDTTTGASNTALGYMALQANTTQSSSTAVGANALQVSFGGSNTAVGNNALSSDAGGIKNTGVGVSSLRAITGGNTNTAIGYWAGYQDKAQNDFETLKTISDTTIIGQSAQATCSSCVIIGGQGANAASYGFGTPNPTNFLSVEPVQYNTGTVATTSSSGAVVGTGTTFTAAMVGSEIYIATNTTTTATYKGTISAFTDATHITVTPNVTLTLAGADYYILYTGLQVKNDGTIYTSGGSTTQFQVQNASGTAVLNVDTSNGRVIIGNGSTGDTTGYTLVLDTKTGSSADPTGVNGAMYYNATLGKFRCYENSAWVNCINTGTSSEFGDGSDGSLTFDGTTTVLTLIPSSNIYTLINDIYASSITINSGVTIVTAGYRIFCTGTITNTGTIQNNGNNGGNAAVGSVGAGGIAVPTGFYLGGTAGGNGGSVGVGVNGTAGAVSSDFGGAGGSGGTNTSIGGSGGTINPPAATYGGTKAIKVYPVAVFGTLHNPGTTSVTAGFEGGMGGGGGGSSTSGNRGGGGGSGGGVVFIAAKTIVNNGAIQANGGNGGNGNASGGVGGGGGGGLVMIFSSTYSGNAATATGGTKGTTGSTTSANDGSAGRVLNETI